MFVVILVALAACGRANFVAGHSVTEAEASSAILSDTADIMAAFLEPSGVRLTKPAVLKPGLQVTHTRDGVIIHTEDLIVGSAYTFYESFDRETHRMYEIVGQELDGTLALSTTETGSYAFWINVREGANVGVHLAFTIRTPEYEQFAAAFPDSRFCYAIQRSLLSEKQTVWFDDISELTRILGSDLGIEDITGGELLKSANTWYMGGNLIRSIHVFPFWTLQLYLNNNPISDILDIGSRPNSKDIRTLWIRGLDNSFSREDWEKLFLLPGLSILGVSGTSLPEKLEIELQGIRKLKFPLSRWLEILRLN